jgi:uncharacterized protein (AIM24 family)
MTGYPPTTPLRPSGPAVPARSNTCAWCGTVTDGTPLSCPRCGASMDVRSTVSQSGWTEVPGQHDMAKIQFGKSSVQIEGAYVPVIDVNLAAQDSVYFPHHVLLWKEAQTKVSALPLKGAWKRMMAGMPVVMTQAQGPGRIAFSRDAPGEMMALPIQPSHSVDVREHIFMVASGSVVYDWFQTNVWFTTKNGDETETHYPLGMYMDRFVAQKDPGLVIVHGAGNVFLRTLAPGEAILVKPTSILFKDSTVQMHLHMETPKSNFGLFSFFTLRYMWLALTGPGRVAVQSAFEPVEDDGRAITSTSPSTHSRW